MDVNTVPAPAASPPSSGRTLTITCQRSAEPVRSELHVQCLVCYLSRKCSTSVA